MCTNIGDFSSLFEIAAGITLAVGVLQEIHSRKLGDIVASEVRIRELLGIVPLSDEQTHDAHEIMIELTPKTAAAKKAAGQLLSGCRVGLILGFSIPIIALHEGAMLAAAPERICDPIITIYILITISFLWGPFWFIFYWALCRRNFNPIISKLDDLHARLIRNESL